MSTWNRTAYAIFSMNINIFVIIFWNQQSSSSIYDYGSIYIIPVNILIRFLHSAEQLLSTKHLPVGICPYHRDLPLWSCKWKWSQGTTCTTKFQSYPGLLKWEPSKQPLTHWGRDEMDALTQTAFSSAFFWKKMFDFRLKFHWSLFLSVQSTIFQHWFR